MSRKWSSNDLHCFSESRLLSSEMCLKVIVGTKLAVSCTNMIELTPYTEGKELKNNKLIKWPIIIIIIINNFSGCNSHGHHGSKRRELAQHGSHAFTNTLTPTQVQPSCAKCQLSYYIIWNRFYFLFLEGTWGMGGKPMCDCFLQLSHELPSDLVSLLPERVTTAGTTSPRLTVFRRDTP